MVVRNDHGLLGTFLWETDLPREEWAQKPFLSHPLARKPIRQKCRFKVQKLHFGGNRRLETLERESESIGKSEREKTKYKMGVITLTMCQSRIQFYRAKRWKWHDKWHDKWVLIDCFGCHFGCQQAFSVHFGCQIGYHLGAIPMVHLRPDLWRKAEKTLCSHLQKRVRWCIIYRPRRYPDHERPHQQPV